MEDVFALEILFETTELRKKLLTDDESEIECGTATISNFGEEIVQFVQKSHPVYVTMKLLL
jgi:hypothetical protein